MYSLDDIVLFVGVVDAGGFSAAAKVLKLSTPLLSKRVAALENALNTRLLNRTTRRLSLTEAGTVFYRHSVRVLAEAREAEDAVNFLNAAPRGLLRVSVPVTFGTQQLARVMPGFLERYPEVQVEMDISDRQVDLAEEGYDLAIRITRNPQQLLSARRLTHTRRLVCAAPSYWDRHGRPQTPAELVSHECIVYTLNPSFNEWVFKSSTGEETISARGRFKVNNTSAMLEAAIGGLGVIMLTSLSVERALNTGELEAVLTNYITPEAEIYVLYLQNRYLSNKARAFIDYLLEHYGN
jgi:LysR family transcriptional regulator, transcriptional activator for dmlA